MSQHDFVIDNQGFAATRADINAAIAALATCSSGATEPATKYVYQLWADTTSGILKQRNAANNAWVSLLNLATGAPVAGVAAGAITSSGLTQATSRMLGRSTAGTGAVEEISLASTLELLAGILGVKDASIGASKLSGAQSGSAPVFGVRAWCKFNGGTTGTNAPIAGGNIATVTYNGAGNYTATFTTAMQDADYAVTISVSTGAGAYLCGSITSQSAGSFTFTTPDFTSTLRNSLIVTVTVTR